MFKKSMLTLLLGTTRAVSQEPKPVLDLVTTITPVQQIIHGYLPDTWELVHTLDYCKRGYDHIVISPDNEHLAIVIPGNYGNYGVDLINLKTGLLVRNFKLEKPIASVAFLSGGKYLD